MDDHQYQDIKAALERIETSITGNVEGTRLGLWGHIRSLNEWRRRTTWFMRAFIVAILGVVGEKVWSIFTGPHHQ